MLKTASFAVMRVDGSGRSWPSIDESGEGGFGRDEGAMRLGDGARWGGKRSRAPPQRALQFDHSGKDSIACDNRAFALVSKGLCGVRHKIHTSGVMAPA